MNVLSFILRLFISALAVFIAAYILPGVQVDSFWTAVIVAILIGVVNMFIKPIIVFLTLPVTVITLGLFLLVINAALILLVDALIDGFSVDSFWWAVLFSIVLSLVSGFLNMLRGEQ
jgi:putative membrane protein